MTAANKQRPSHKSQRCLPVSVRFTRFALTHTRLPADSGGGNAAGFAQPVVRDCLDAIDRKDVSQLPRTAATPALQTIAAATPPSPQATTQETAAYVKKIADSLRRLTGRGSNDLAFLDYMLAVVCEEAGKMAAHGHH